MASSAHADRFAVALKAVNEGKMNPHRAAKAYGVPASSLYNSAKKQKSGYEKRGRTTTFPLEVELEIKRLIFTASGAGQGFVKRDILKAARCVAEKRKLPFKGTEKWIDGFLKRHPTIRVRLAKVTNTGRLKSFNRISAAQYFKLLKPIVSQYKPEEICNSDDKGFDVEHGGHFVSLRKPLFPSSLQPEIQPKFSFCRFLVKQAPFGPRLWLRRRLTTSASPLPSSPRARWDLQYGPFRA
jgi:helix-turn-helix, Psq domain